MQVFNLSVHGEWPGESKNRHMENKRVKDRKKEKEKVDKNN